MQTFLLVLTNVIGGSTFTATTVMLRSFSQADAAVLRMGLASALFLPFLWRGRRRLAALSAADWGRLAAVGTFGYSLPLALGNYGQKLSDGSSAALFIGMEPVSIVLLSCLFLGERLTGLRVFSMIAGLAGATLISFQGPPHLGGALAGRTVGNLLLAATGFFWGLYTVIGKPTLKRVEPMDFTAATTVLCFLGLLAWYGCELTPSAWPSLGAAPWGAMAYLAAIGSFAGALIWNVALTRVEASRQANYVFLQPLVGVLLGVCFMGEPLTRWTVAGGSLVFAGMWAASR